MEKYAYEILAVLNGALLLASDVGIKNKEDIIAATVIDKLEFFIKDTYSLRGYTKSLSKYKCFDWNKFLNTNAGAIITRYTGNPAKKDEILWKHIPDILDAYFTYVKKLKLDKHFRLVLGDELASQPPLDDRYLLENDGYWNVFEHKENHAIRFMSVDDHTENDRMFFFIHQDAWELYFKDIFPAYSK